MFNDTAILTVNVVDVNDNAPMFQNTPYSFTLAENLPVDPTMAIGKVTAIDDDSGQNKEVWKVNVIVILISVFIYIICIYCIVCIIMCIGLLW